jgi:rRNA-processing protein FCF1
MIRVFLDTNFIVSCLKQKIPFIEEIDRALNFQYELVVVSQVLDELAKLSKSKEDKLVDRERAELGFKIIKKAGNEGKIKILSGEGRDADEALLKIMKKDDILASLDKELRKKTGCRIILIKQGSYLGLV